VSDKYFQVLKQEFIPMYHGKLMIRQIISISSENEKGAAVVEFAFALLALLVFFGIFMQFFLIFSSYSRLSFAGFASSRTYSVLGQGPARQVVMNIDPGATVNFASEVVLTRDIPIPAGIDEFLTRGQGRFKLKFNAPAFQEPVFTDDDNPDPF